MILREKKKRASPEIPFIVVGWLFTISSWFVRAHRMKLVLIGTGFFIIAGVFLFKKTRTILSDVEKDETTLNKPAVSYGARKI